MKSGSRRELERNGGLTLITLTLTLTLTLSLIGGQRRSPHRALPYGIPLQHEWNG